MKTKFRPRVPHLSRRTIALGAVAFIALQAFAPVAATAADEAAGFPTKPVHIVVPVAAGGSADKLTRLIAQGLTERWGQPVVVENLAGASGTIGAARVAKSPADGYTLLQQGEGLTLNSILFERLPYDSQKAFAPVIKAVVNPQILVVNPQTGITDFRTYLARAKAKPQSISLGLPGNGGIAHVAHEMISQDTGALVNYIPYSGGGPATLDVLAGHVDATLITLAAVTDHVRAGKLRALAVTTPYRSAALPDVPTMAEAGGPASLEVNSFVSLLAPKGVSAAVKAKINADVAKVIADPEIRARFDTFAFEPLAWSPEEIERNAEAKSKVYGELVRRGNISLD